MVDGAGGTCSNDGDGDGDRNGDECEGRNSCKFPTAACVSKEALTAVDASATMLCFLSPDTGFEFVALMSVTSFGGTRRAAVACLFRRFEVLLMELDVCELSFSDFTVGTKSVSEAPTELEVVRVV